MIGNLQPNEQSVILQKIVINVSLFNGKRTVLTFPHLSSMTENVQYANSLISITEREVQLLLLYAGSSDEMLPSVSSHFTETVVKGLSNNITV